MKLSEKVAIITGGGRGIGRNIALAYAREGASVVVAARTEEEIGNTAREIAGLGGEALAVGTDVAKWDEVKHLADLAAERFGGIDILVNNAGVLGPVGPVSSVDPAAWNSTVAVNLLGAFHCCRAVVPHMISRKSGKIINVSGGGSVSPRPFFTAYGASKAAIAMFTESLAAELGPHGIGVNTMAPGATPTGMVEAVLGSRSAAGPGEVKQAESVLHGGGVDMERQAALAVFLASGDSDGLTGRMIHTNDAWPSFIGRISEVMGTDAYTIRRIQPS